MSERGIYDKRGMAVCEMKMNNRKPVTQCLDQHDPIKIQFTAVSTANEMEITESLAKEIWAEYYTPLIGKDQVDYMLERFQSKQAIAEQIKAGVLYFIIQEDHEIAGYVAVQPRGHELFLSKIYLKSPKRGRGYGKKAVQFAESLAKARNMSKIVLTVNKNNVNSIRAYEKMGFKNVGPVVQDIGNGFVMDDYKMEKAI